MPTTARQFRLPAEAGSYESQALDFMFTHSRGKMEEAHNTKRDDKWGVHVICL
jgi:hypothetical protein